MTTILIVDDEYDIVNALSMVMQDEGFRVRVAYDGRSGLESVNEELPDLILLDIMLPYLSGLELLEELRAKELSSQIPIILMSGFPPNRETQDSGWDAFIQKPFDLDRLIDLVNDLLSR